ncbi:MAG: hypothetical protein FWG78_03335 [Coriobacteriia bacterium]|nr:hypothetical protein [Coriobacteriia bacterium]
MLLAAFAWGVIQSAINQVANNASADALLVDEFARKDDTSWDKLVRVDNIGTAPFIARISAAEFMQWISTSNWSDGQNIDPAITDFAPLISSAEATMNAVLNAPFGTEIDTQTPWFDVAPDMWSIRGLTDATSLIQAAPSRGHAASGMPFAEYWRWTQPYLMTYTQWEGSTSAARANRWVLADDGYFYYTSVIEPHQSSNPLMTALLAADGFNPTSSAFYYAIDIHMEVVTRDDAETMKEGGTTGSAVLREASMQGKAIIDSIRWTVPVIMGVSINNDSDPFLAVTQFGSSPTLGVDASGDGLTYQWQVSPDGIAWANVSGTSATTPAFTGVDTAALGTFFYRVLVANSGETPQEGDGYTSASESVTIEVVDRPLPTPVPNPNRELFGSVPFFRIAEYRDGTNTYDLYVTQHAYAANPQVAFIPTGTGANGVLFNTDVAHGNYWLAREDDPSLRSNIMVAMDQWYTNLSTTSIGDLRARAVQADFLGSNTGPVADRDFGVAPVGADGIVGTHTGFMTAAPNSPENDANRAFLRSQTNWPNAYSRPSARMAGMSTTTNPTTGQGIVAFPLSDKEIASYLSEAGYDDGGPTTDTFLTMGAYAIGTNHATTTTSGTWWSRSRGTDQNNLGANNFAGFAGAAVLFSSSGGLINPPSTGQWIVPLGAVVTTPSYGLRPAIWVRR